MSTSDEGDEPSLFDAIDTVKKQGSVAEELKKLYDKKESIESKLTNLEKQIYALEGSYLQDTRYLGNILSGWDAYLTQRSGAIKRPQKFRDMDRLFSLSSATSLKNLNEAAKPDKDSERANVASLQSIKAGTAPVSKKQGPGRPRKLTKLTLGNDDEEYVAEV